MTHLLWMDEIHLAPPKKPSNDDSLENTNVFNHGFISRCERNSSTVWRRAWELQAKSLGRRQSAPVGLSLTAGAKPSGLTVAC